MDPIELRDLDEARRYILEGLWLQRALKPTARTVRNALEWAMTIANEGDALPPVGFVADLGNIAFGVDPDQRMKELQPVPGWPPALGRAYEDHVLGKFYADWTFERASDAVRKYKDTDKDKNRARGLAYIVTQIRQRADLPGVLLSTAVIRGLLTTNPDEVLAAGWEGLMRDGPSPMIVEMYEQLVSAARRLAEVLAPEDILALEQGTALMEVAPYRAHRDILQATARLQKRLPARPVKPLIGRKEVPTRVLDEDQYPVGGYTSISTKGSIESLLHSQLAYMEDESPDLFDMKFVRDELFYYSRDENQFLRRRRSFVFVLFPDLVTARFKGADLPYQRIVMVQSMILALVRKLTEWLSTDAIRFEVLFVQEGGKNPLAEEAHLLKLLLREPIERGDGEVIELPNQDAVVKHLNYASRMAQVHCLTAAKDLFEMPMDNVVITKLIVDGPRPVLGEGEDLAGEVDETVDDAFDLWQETILRILQLWV